MAAKLASTGNGRNPMALVTSCGMSRENKIEFSGIRHTHGIQLYRKPPWRVSSVICRTLPRMPLVEFSLRGHLFKVEAAAQVNHDHHLGKAAEGLTREGPIQQDGAGFGRGKTSALFPRPQGTSQPYQTYTQGGNKDAHFCPKSMPFPNPLESSKFRLFLHEPPYMHIIQKYCECSGTQCRPQEKKEGLRKIQGAASVFRNEIPRT